MSASHPITRYLNRAPAPIFNAYCIAAAFTAYFCMYAYRKPFTAGRFEGVVDFFGGTTLDYKVVLLIAQVLGYTCSKFLGIKVVSESSGAGRGRRILGLLACAELALLLFPLIPRPWNVICLFLNGVPLGMIWGLVFGYLEGRRSTEALGAGLSASYIIASGAMKSIGRWVELDLGYNESWMPAVSGLLFVPLTLVAVYLLKQIPPPSREDEALRTVRVPMTGAQRKDFFMRFAPGLTALTGLHVVLTAFRGFRDDFAREIWDDLGYVASADIYTKSELPIAFGVLVGLACMMMIRSNRKAVLLVHGLMMAGTALIGLSALGFQLGWLSPMAFMILVGLGLYLGYVPFGSMLFDRMIAYVGIAGTAGFMIYVADSFGYLGQVGVLLYKSLGHKDVNYLEFFLTFAYVTSTVCTLAFAFSLIYFARPGIGRSQRV